MKKRKEKKKKIKIGISSCLLGNKVRYDGGHKLDPFIFKTLDQYFSFVPVCPEAECGFGIPREPMRLEGSFSNPRLITVLSRVDVTNKLLSWSKSKIRTLKSYDISGFIFKSRSPSCGISHIAVYNKKSRPVKKGQGIFVNMIIKHFPFIPYIDEKKFHDLKFRESFIEQVFVMKQLLDLIEKKKSK